MNSLGFLWFTLNVRLCWVPVAISACGKTMEVIENDEFKNQESSSRLAFCLRGGLVFSSGMEAAATHGDNTGIVAEDVVPTNRMHVEEFLNKIVRYYEEVYKANFDPNNLQVLIKEVTLYNRAVRQEGDYKHGEVYSLSINNRNIVTNHARYPDLFGYRFDPPATSGSDVAGTISDLTEGAGNASQGMNHCEQYGDAGRWACARNVSDNLGGHITFIAGLHHRENDSAFVEPVCTGFKLTPSAEDVHGDPTDKNLEDYVKGVIRVAQAQFARAFGAAVAQGGSPQQIQLNTLTNLNDQSACYRVGDLRHGNIYTFIMEAKSDPEEPAAVIINGNNFDLNGTNLDLNDDRLSGETNIAKLFSQELGDVEIGSSTYVNYHWDDPTNLDDNVANFLENKKVPGTSCKRSYIEVASITAMVPSLNPTLYIFGSGTYPGDDVCKIDDDDGGCAIAGTANTYKGALLNLFVMASVLFPVVFLRRRT